MRNSLFGGYPYGDPKSQEVFPNRLEINLVDGKVSVHVNTETYILTEEDDFKDFILDRLFDYSNALSIAEQQVRDLQVDYPFIPQDLGFEETDVVFEGDGFVPKCYKKGKHLLGRVAGTDHDWFLSEHGIIKLETANIAFTVFRSLGVIDGEEVEKEVIIDSNYLNKLKEEE